MIDTSLFRERLQEELAIITKELQELGIQNPQSKEDWIAIPKDIEVFEADENVGADRVEDWEERNATINALEISYNDIVRALSKIEEGIYGLCEVGGEEIEEERLEADPSARTCIEHIGEELEV